MRNVIYSHPPPCDYGGSGEEEYKKNYKTQTHKRFSLGSIQRIDCWLYQYCPALSGNCMARHTHTHTTILKPAGQYDTVSHLKQIVKRTLIATQWALRNVNFQFVNHSLSLSLSPSLFLSYFVCPPHGHLVVTWASLYQRSSHCFLSPPQGWTTKTKTNMEANVCHFHRRK